jgi:hypothetical protein
MSENNMQKYNQYFSSRPKIGITMPTGKRIDFVGGMYLTDKEDEIGFLNEQIKLGHQMIYIRKGAEVVDADALDPLAAVKKKAVEEYLAQQALNSNPNRDMGNTAATGAGLDILTSKGVAQITAPSKK